MRRALPAVVWLALAWGCTGYQPDVSYGRLAEHQAWFWADGQTLRLDVQDAETLGVVGLQAFERDDFLFVTAVRGDWDGQDIALDVDAYGLGPGWRQRIYWVGPSGTFGAAKVEVWAAPRGVESVVAEPPSGEPTVGGETVGEETEVDEAEVIEDTARDEEQAQDVSVDMEPEAEEPTLDELD